MTEMNRLVERMALFGAASQLERKECAALIAAQEVPEAVSALGLDVGVGVATGSASRNRVLRARRSVFLAAGEGESVRLERAPSFPAERIGRQRAAQRTGSY